MSAFRLIPVAMTALALGASHLAQAQTSASGQVVVPEKPPINIITPINTSGLQGGRVGDAGKAPKVAKPVASKTPATDKPLTASKPATAKPAPLAPPTGRGDEASYSSRGMLKDQVGSNNRYGGNTYSMPLETLAVDFEDGLAGFASFDKLGTLREKKVFRANGAVITDAFDARSGDLLRQQIDTPGPNAALTAGGLVVMPGTTLSTLIQRNTTASSALPPAQSASGTIEGINRLIDVPAP